MSVKIEDNKINIAMDISRVLKGLSDDDIQQLIEDLSCEDMVIKNVSDQIIHGCTDMGWHGGVTRGIEPSTPLDKAVREVSIKSSDVAQNEIEMLTRKLKSKQKQIDELWEEVHELRDMLGETTF